MSDHGITAATFDKLVAPRGGPSRLWGAKQIGDALGVSVDRVYRLATVEGVPIYRPPGSNSYFAIRAELEAWLRSKPSHPARDHQHQPEEPELTD